MEGEKFINCTVLELPDSSWHTLNPDNKECKVQWSWRYGGWMRAKKNTTTAWRVKSWEDRKTALKEGLKVLL